MEAYFFDRSGNPIYIGESRQPPPRTFLKEESFNQGVPEVTFRYFEAKVILGRLCYLET